MPDLVPGVQLCNHILLGLEKLFIRQLRKVDPYFLALFPEIEYIFLFMSRVNEK
jgi:hypothetical protein